MDSPEVAEKVDLIYKTIIKAGTHRASSIEVAEAAKGNRKYSERYKHSLNE